MTAPLTAPFGVRLLSLLLYVAAFIDVIGGAVLIFQSNDDNILDAADATSGQVTTYGIVAIVFGIFVCLVAGALRSGAQWARVLVGIIAIARFVALFIVIATSHVAHWFDAFAPAILYALVAGYLFFDNDARRFFEPRTLS
ncbi:MAG: hypothetical protein AAGA42_15905 [Actinomycetota bacterium]